MQRMILGCGVAAIVMFILGFVFYATPLGMTAYAKAEPAVVARVQAAMADLPESGAYAIPDPQAVGAAQDYERGPVGVLRFVKSGYPLFDPMVLLKGLGHYFVSVLFFGLTLLATAEKLDLRTRRSVIAGTVVGATVMNVLGDPVWYRLDWTYSLYVFVANSIILGAGALIVARWFVPRARA
ncbi:MAG: hypothetical protein H7268_16770 [Sandarakinorhabdus sp.]|nr:hypothetical protein [Sandarakinorhabdus sp.]